MKECLACRRCHDDQRALCPDDGANLEETFAGSPVLDEKYLLLERLGRGGMGRVYKARHLGLGRVMAVKLLEPKLLGDERSRARFEREAAVLGRLEHPHVVAVSDFGVDRPRRIPYLAMAHLEGSSLAERLRRDGPLTPAEAIALLGQVAEAVDSAHGAGILHRDLKPSNVFWVEDGAGRGEARVLDFGLARFFDDSELTPALESQGADGAESRVDGSELTAAGELPGTPGYVAPEVLAGAEATPAADVYALGVLAFTALAGRPPTAAEARGSPRPSAVCPQLPGELDAPLLSALDPVPERRPPSAGAFVTGLETAYERALRRRSRQRERPRRAALIAFGSLVALALTALALEPLRGLEERLVDARFYLSSPRSPTHLLLLVPIDEASLLQKKESLAECGQEIGELLSRALGAGARGVGLDLLMPPAWGQTEAFCGLAVEHPERLALAAFSAPDGRVVGPEVADGLIAAALGPAETRELFGFVNLDRGPGGVMRRARARFRDAGDAQRSSFAARIAEIVGGGGPPAGDADPGFLIDFTLDPRRFERLSFGELGSELERHPERFRGRFLLVGATWVGSGEGPYPVPAPRGLRREVSGIELQALAAHTLLDGRPLRAAGAWWWLAAGVFAATALAAAAAPGSLARAALAVAGLAALWALLAWAFFVWAGQVVPVAAFTATLGATAAAGRWAWRVGGRQKSFVSARKPRTSTLEESGHASENLHPTSLVHGSRLSGFLRRPARRGGARARSTPRGGGRRPGRLARG